MADMRMEADGGLTLITLNRPEKRNALSAEMVEALLTRVTEAAKDGTYLLAIRGEGRNFSAGFDFSDLETQSDGDLLLRFVRIEQLLQALHHAPFDTLALAHGRNFGAGADIVCACAHRIAAPESAFRMPGLGFGVVLSTRRMTERVGADEARRVLQEGRSITSDEALSCGFLTAITRQEEWPSLISRHLEIARSLTPAAASRLYAICATDHRDTDLAELVRSAANSDLRERLAAYRERMRRSMGGS